MASDFDAEAFRSNQDLFAACFRENPNLLESVLLFLTDKNLVSLSSDDEREFNNETAKKATYLIKSVESALENDLTNTNTSVILDAFRQHQQLKDILADIKAKNKTGGSSTSSGSHPPPLVATSTTGIATVSTSSTGTPTGGYDDDLFIATPSKDHQCPICRLTLREPILFSCCGAHICQNCVDRCHNKDRCPMCNETRFATVLNKQLRGQILSLRVRCRHTPCTWTCELLDLDKHVEKSCLHAPISCPLNCGELVTRATSKDHQEMWCRKRPMDLQMKGLQRLMLAEITEAGNNVGKSSAVSNVVVRHFQKLFDLHRGNTRTGIEKRSEMDANVEGKISDLKGTIQLNFEQYTDAVGQLKPSYDALTASLSQQIEAAITESTSSTSTTLNHTKSMVSTVTTENANLTQRMSTTEEQLGKMRTLANKLMDSLKSKQLAEQERNKMMTMKDMEIEKLRLEVDRLNKLLENTENKTSDGVTTDNEGALPINDKQDQTEDKQEGKVVEPATDKGVTTPTGETAPTVETTSSDDDATDNVDDPLKAKEGSCSSIDVFEHDTVRDVSVQFDYWVPMKDLLYGATVVDSRVFNVHGDDEQTYPWPECGFSLYIPADSLDRTESCPVAVKALISGRFKFPKGFQLISALYAISPGRKFKKKIKMSIQHCFQIEREEQLKRLCFIKACGTANPSDPYVFKHVKGGTFTTGNQYCDLWQKEFSIYAAGICTGEDGPNPEGDGPDQQQSNEVGQVNGDDHQDEEEEGPAPDDDDSQGHGEPNDEEPPPSEGNNTAVVNNDSQGNINNEERRIDNEVGGASVPDTVSSDGQYFSKKYQSHFFFETASNSNSWNFRLVAIEDLAVHSKFLKTIFSGAECVEWFMFQFLYCPEPSINFVFSEERIRALPPGWHVRSISDPCNIPKEEIDDLSLKSRELRNQHPPEEDITEMITPMIPIRTVSVFADASCNNSCMECGVAIKGIKQTKTIHIVRQLTDRGGGVVPSPGPSPRGAIARGVSNDLNRITDTDKLKDLLANQLNGNFARLKNLFSGTIDSLAAKLFENGMISGDVKSNPNFNTIWDEVMSAFYFKRKAQDIIDHCQKFLQIMSGIGVPQRGAAKFIAEGMSEEISKQFNVSIVFIG